MAMVHCQDLVVSYGDFRAVDRVSFDVAQGEILGLLGPNGAGKTTVIRALTTILDPDSGEVTIGGEPLANQTGVRRLIGVLPESNGYPNSQTALGWLRFHGQLFGLSSSESGSRAEKLLSQLGLSADKGRRIATFSRGMRQRLGLCRALINHPAVLFLDEPTLGLDPSGQGDILTHLARTATEDGTSVVLCSHLLDEVERVCDRIAILDRGRVVADGTVDAVIETAGIGGRGRVRVAPGDVGAAATVLQSYPGVVSVEFDSGRVGEIELELESTTSGHRNDLVTSLIESGVGLRSFDLQGASLSEAYLALTSREEVA